VWIHLLILGQIDGASSSAAPPIIPTIISSGVRRSRFLRRGPRLPWDETPEEVVTIEEVAQGPRRKRIRLPKEVIAAASPMQIEVDSAQMPAFKIHVPDVGAAIVKQDDEEEAIILALLQ